MSFTLPFTLPSLIILIGTLLAGIGGLWASHKQNQFELELKEKQEILNAKNEEIIELNQQIAILSYNTMNMVTGGDSYTSIIFMDNGTELLSEILLKHHGKFPIYDLVITIHDADAQRNIAVIPVGNIGSTQHIQYWPLEQKLNFDRSGKTSQRLNVIFSARNGMWFQQYIYKKLHDKWTLATRIVRPEPNFDKSEKSIVYKEISSEFPLDESEIDWN